MINTAGAYGVGGVAVQQTTDGEREREMRLSFIHH